MQQRGVDLEELEFLAAPISVQELQPEMWLHVLRCVCVENMWLEWVEGYPSCTFLFAHRTLCLLHRVLLLVRFANCHVRCVSEQCCHFRKDCWATLPRDLCRRATGVFLVHVGIRCARRLISNHFSRGNEHGEFIDIYVNLVYVSFALLKQFLMLVV